MTNYRKEEKYRVSKWGVERLPITAKDVEAMSTYDLASLIQKLQEREVELQRQNEQLRMTRTELEQSRDKYSEVWEFAPVGYVILRRDGVVVDVNLSTAVLLGTTRTKLMESNFKRYLAAESRQAFQEHLAEMFADRARRSCQLRLCRRDGSECEALMESAVIANASGEFDTCISALIDVTSLRRDELSSRERYERERKLREDLEDEMKKRVEFTRILAHELKTPLTALVASSSALVANVTEEGPIQHLARMIDRSAARLNNRIDELLDLARGEIGMLRLSCDRMDPGKLLHEVASDMLQAAMARGLKLEVEISNDLPSIVADETRIRQVLYNLLTNALKFTSNNGIITLRSYYENETLVVEVRDTGRGIKEEDLGTLFQPYRRLSAGGDNTVGLGLGLGLSRMLVELHGGSIWAKSEPGKGSTFAFSLPAKPAGAT